MRSPQPSLEYLATCSETSLEGFELARLDEIAQLRREIQDIHEEWIEAEVAARLARLLLEGRRTEMQSPAESMALPEPGCAPATILPGTLPLASSNPCSGNASSSLLRASVVSSARIGRLPRTN